MTEKIQLLDRITVRAGIFGGKPIIRDMGVAIKHVLGKLAAGDTLESGDGVVGHGGAAVEGLAAVRECKHRGGFVIPRNYITQ